MQHRQDREPDWMGRSMSIPTKRESGFSLVELLIACSVILIIAALAIPNFLRARLLSNEASAVASSRLINNSEATYTSYYQAGYTTLLTQLGPPPSGPATSSHADLIDSVLAGGFKSGYSFVYAPGAVSGTTNTSYSLHANPIVLGTTGTRYFYTDPSGVIRQNTTSMAGPSDSPVQ